MEIFPAILRNDIQKISRIIHDEQTPINELFDSIMLNTPLQYSIIHQQFQFVKLFAERVDINHQNKYGMTALHQAVFENNIDVITYLLKLGANPNLPDKFGKTPLYESISFSPHMSETILFEGKAQVDPKAMVRACLHRNASIIKLLAQHICDINVSDEFSTPLIAAITFYLDINMIRFFIEDCKADPNFQGTSGTTPLIAAITQQCDIDLVSYLLKSGANPNHTDKLRNTPLHYAADNCNTRLTKMLLRNGARRGINTLNIDAQSPLSLACRSVSNLKFITLLLQNRADPNFFTDIKESAMYRAIARMHKPLLDLLVRYGGSIDDNGILIYFIKYGVARQVDFILQNLSPKIDEIHLEVAFECHKEDTCVALLRRYTSKITFSILVAAVRSRKIGILSHILSHFEVDLSQTNVMENTILHIAAEHSTNDIIELIMEQEDIDLDHPNSFGRTAADVAKDKPFFNQLLFFTRNKRTRETSLFYLLLKSSLTT